MAAKHASLTSIFWGYGSKDALIKPELTNLSVDFLKSSIDIPSALKIGDKGIWSKAYNGMGHETCMDELDDLREFIKKFIPGDV
jgi:predicted esterase